MNENWKPVVGYEGHYLVSDLGRVRSIDKTVKGKYGNTYLRKGRLRKVRLEHNGYLRVSLSVRGDVTYHLVHRLVAEAFIPKSNAVQDVNHKDGDKTNNAVTNLEWLSRRDNCIHALRTNLYQTASGQQVAGSKLTEQAVRDIRCMFESGARQTEIASSFGLDPSTVSVIVRRKRWKHVA